MCLIQFATESGQITLEQGNDIAAGLGLVDWSRSFGYNDDNTARWIQSYGQSIWLTYDDRGLILESSDSQALTTFTYDGNQRLTERKETVDGVTRTHIWTWTDQNELETHYDPVVEWV